MYTYKSTRLNDVQAGKSSRNAHGSDVLRRALRRHCVPFGPGLSVSGDNNNDRDVKEVQLCVCVDNENFISRSSILASVMLWLELYVREVQPYADPFPRTGYSGASILASRIPYPRFWIELARSAPQKIPCGIHMRYCHACVARRRTASNFSHRMTPEELTWVRKLRAMHMQTMTARHGPCLLHRSDSDAPIKGHSAPCPVLPLKRRSLEHVPTASSRVSRSWRT